MEDEIDLSSMVAWVGPLATINREPGQAWKGAATAVDLCAGVWLVRVAALNSLIITPISLNIFAILVTENADF